MFNKIEYNNININYYYYTMEPPTYLAEKNQHPRDECITFDEVAQSQKEVQRQTS